jgi:hypothetical protein
MQPTGGATAKPNFCAERAAVKTSSRRLACQPAHGLDVVWTLHAARRVIERKLDPSDVLHALHVGLACGMFRHTCKFALGKVLVVAEIKELSLVVITVARRKRKGIRRNEKARRT